MKDFLHNSQKSVILCMCFFGSGLIESTAPRFDADDDDDDEFMAKKRILVSYCLAKQKHKSTPTALSTMLKRDHKVKQ